MIYLIHLQNDREHDKRDDVNDDDDDMWVVIKVYNILSFSPPNSLSLSFFLTWYYLI